MSVFLLRVQTTTTIVNQWEAYGQESAQKTVQELHNSIHLVVWFCLEPTENSSALRCYPMMTSNCQRIFLFFLCLCLPFLCPLLACLFAASLQIPSLLFSPHFTLPIFPPILSLCLLYHLQTSTYTKPCARSQEQRQKGTKMSSLITWKCRKAPTPGKGVGRGCQTHPSFSLLQQAVFARMRTQVPVPGP